MHATAPSSDTFVPHRFPARSASSCSWRAVSPATEATKNTKLCLSATGHQAAALLKAASCSQQQRLPASIAPKTAPPSSPVATVKQQPPQLEGAPNRSPDHRGNKPSPLPTSEHAKSQHYAEPSTGTGTHQLRRPESQSPTLNRRNRQLLQPNTRPCFTESQRDKCTDKPRKAAGPTSSSKSNQGAEVPGLPKAEHRHPRRRHRRGPRPLAETPSNRHWERGRGR